MLEPCDAKVSSTVLRGLGDRKVAQLLGKIEKALICWIRFGVLALFAISGMNKPDSALCARQNSLGSRDGGFIIASPGGWVVRAVPTTVFYFIPSAMTGFIANIFPSRNCVSPNEAFEVLEPDDGKLSCPVLRGLGDRKVARLLGTALLIRLVISESPTNRELSCIGSDARTLHH